MLTYSVRGWWHAGHDTFYGIALFHTKCIFDFNNFVGSHYLTPTFKFPVSGSQPMQGIHRACYVGDFAWVKRLVEEEEGEGVLELWDGFGWTPIFCAASRGHMEIVSYLVKKGARIDISDLYERSTPLLEACNHDYPMLVKLLIEGGANVSHRDSRGTTALFWACYYGHARVTRLLLTYPAVDVDAALIVGDGPLHMACANGHVVCTRLLLDAGANPTLTDCGGRDAFRVARRPGTRECLDLLEEWQKCYMLVKAHMLRETAHAVHRLVFVETRRRVSRSLPGVNVVTPYKRGIDFDCQVKALVVNHIVGDLKPELLRELLGEM